jgi:hypothetical protein
LSEDLLIEIKNKKEKIRAICLRLTPQTIARIARQPNDAMAHMLRGRDTLDLGRKVNSLAIFIKIVALSYSESTP